MKHLLLLITLIGLATGLSRTGFAATCEGKSEMQETVSAILCQREQCSDLEKADAMGITPEMVYYYHCSSDAIEIRQTLRDATIENVIFEVQRTRFEKPPTQIPPCECLAMIYPDCDVEQCQEKPQNSPTEEAGKTTTQGSVPAQTGTGIAFAGGGCTLQGIGSTSEVGALLTFLALGFLPLIKLALRIPR